MLIGRSKHRLSVVVCFLVGFLNFSCFLSVGAILCRFQLLSFQLPVTPDILCSDMSKNSELDQNNEVNQKTSPSACLPKHQYSREELIILSKSPASTRRPEFLESAYNCEDGKWDPDRWYKAKFGLSREASALTLGSGKDRRRLNDFDVKRRPPVNDSVERLKEEKDGIVLCPQRRSFGTGCHVQTTLSYVRQLSVPERDDTKGERDRDRDRERPVRKIGSGRIQVDRENRRDYSGLRDLDRDREHNHDFARSRERERIRETDWQREVGDRDLHDADKDRERDRDRRFNRSERFHHGGERDFPDRRDRDFRGRNFEKNSRRRNNRRDDEEPEWFTSGPTSRTDVIELGGFEPGDRRREEVEVKLLNHKSDSRSTTTLIENKPSKESSEADVKVFQHSSTSNHLMAQDEQLQVAAGPNEGQQEDVECSATAAAATPQQNHRASPSNSKLFDFEEILSAILPLNEAGMRHGSRFSHFFSGSGRAVLGSDNASLRDMLMPCDDSQSASTAASPAPVLGSMGTLHSHTGLAHLPIHHIQGQDKGYSRGHTYSLHHHLMCVPNSSGDNNAAIGKTTVPLPITALLNGSGVGSPSACKWKPCLDCSMETPESSLLTDSALSSSGSFSTQDAEAQLKNMLFGGSKDSPSSSSSSGTASPASFLPGVQRKVKTVAELEADMHQKSPQKMSGPLSEGGDVCSPNKSRDMAAFNRLLIMINAASEASQHVPLADSQTSQAGYWMVPGHSEFNHAVMRNKEEQMQLLHQSLKNVQQSVQPLPGMASHALLQQVPPPPSPLPQQQQQQQQLIHQQTQSIPYHYIQNQQQQAALGNAQSLADLMNKVQNMPGLPQAVSTPNPSMTFKPRAQSRGSVISADPVFSFVQQNPTIVMNPASPAPHMTTMLAAQHSAVPSTARIPSPLMFGQQPPLHLRAPSPVLPGQLSSGSLTVGTNLANTGMSSPTGMRSPVQPRVLSPQELSAHAQAVMQSALIKKQLQDQNERYLKKQQERAKSPSQHQINVVKPQTAAQPVLPPNPQPKFQGVAVSMFTPTSVLRKMHSDKILEKQIQAGKAEDEITEILPLVTEQGGGDCHDYKGSHPQSGMPQNSDSNVASDISFLDSVSPNLVAVNSPQDNHLGAGQTTILCGPLSQPMSVEEKMKLSALAEKPGYLSQMLNKSTVAVAAVEDARQGHGRPIVKMLEPSEEERSLQQNWPCPAGQSSKPVTGPQIQPPGTGPLIPETSHFSSIHQSQAKKPVGGRAIIGGSPAQQHAQIFCPSTQNLDVLHLLDHQHLQRLQQVPHCQGVALPPLPLTCLGPHPVAVPVSKRIPVASQPSHSAANAVLIQQQLARASAMNVDHFMAAQCDQQHRSLTSSFPPQHTVMPGVTAHLGPHSHATGPLSATALSAAIQRVASPHGSLRINESFQATPSVNGGRGQKMDLNGGIQHWFNPDILRTQLPTMPPLPAHGIQVITVDEIEKN